MSSRINYTKEQNDWLIDNFYNYNNTVELVNSFNQHFNLNKKYDTIKIHCRKKLNLTRSKEKRNYYTKEQFDWFKNNFHNYNNEYEFDYEGFTNDFYNKFNIKLNKRVFTNIYIKLGLRMGKTHTRFEKEDYIPHNRYGIGFEKKTAGHWWVKIDDKPIKRGEFRRKNYQIKERYLYEKYHNVKLNSNDFIIFLDGNKDNFDKENLIKLTHKELGIMNGNRFHELEDVNLRKSAIIYSKLAVKLKEDI